jgi:glutamate--cysteine ligase
MLQKTLEDKITMLMPFRQTLSQNLMGIERESLRVGTDGAISQEPHPKAYGSALTNPSITTDFSEALIELVTKPFDSADKALDDLDSTQHFVYHHLPQDQRYWPASMPCVTKGETHIPIAQYGDSNRGKMKTVYRNGLANRYGSVMQTIAGIHFNYSFSPDYWQAYQQLIAPDTPMQFFIDEHYMALTRNVLRFGWLISYLFGASAAVCKSFLKDYHKHNLHEFDENSYYLPYATSLRMGDIGYQNSQEDKAGVKANYNSLCHYVHSLRAAMETSSADYEAIGLKKDGEYQQLNTNILQIENEYYASVRPKPKLNGFDKPLNALNKSGIAYIELRSLDVNPLNPLGIDKQQIHFLEAFLLFCLLQKSPPISTAELFEIDSNNHLVAHKGRDPDLLLKKHGKEIPLQDWGLDIVEKVRACSKLLSSAHEKSVRIIAERICNSALTPSAIMLAEMRKNKQGYYQYVNEISHQYKDLYRQQEIDKKKFSDLKEMAKSSLRQQAEIESQDKISFDEFIAGYFSIDG